MRSFYFSAIILTFLLSACEVPQKGDKGEQGLKGEPGTPGTNGKNGVDGSKGPDGAKGKDGLNGTNGLNGEPGPAGKDGKDGLNGKDGAPGIGLPGSDGTSCVGQSVPEGVLVTCINGSFLVKHGDVGPAGAKGDKGDVGSVGPKGDQGLQGVQGVAGKDGAPGLDGLPGVKGDKGDQGSKGDKGDKGDVGAQGPAGKDFVAECPKDSTSVILDGVLVYCYNQPSNKPTSLQECIGTCAKLGMTIVTFEGVTLTCLSNNETYTGLKDFKHWIKDFPRGYNSDGSYTTEGSSFGYLTIKSGCINYGDLSAVFWPKDLSYYTCRCGITPNKF